MPVASIRSFSGGIVPRLDKRLLRDDQAQIAQNAVITSGAMVPLNEPLDVYTTAKAGDLMSAHRLTDANGDDVWLTWTTDVDAARASLGNDPDQRVYYTGDGEPRVTNLTMATSLSDNQYPDACYVLGIPTPASAPTVGTVTGGSAANETRAYVYTFVSITTQSDGSTLEEQGPPSDATSQTGKADGTWPLTGLPTSLNNSNTITSKSHSAGISTIGATSTAYLRVGEYVRDGTARFRLTEITSSTSFKVDDPANAFAASGTWTRDAPHNTTGLVKRVYRTDSAGTYQMVADVALATSTLNDTTLEADLPGVALESQTYLQPPTDLTALISIPNGCLVGISGRNLCYSEPYQPHAWPAANQKALDWNGVSLGSLGNTVIVTTEGSHYVAVGSDPASVTPEKAVSMYPCVSKRGTAPTPYGVAWPTHDGIAIQTPSGADLMTKSLFTRREWELIDGASIIATVHGGRYVARYRMLGAEVTSIMLLDPGDTPAMFAATPQATGIYSDPRTGSLYLLDGPLVKKWDAGVRAQMDWLSKEFVQPFPINWQAAKVDVSFFQSSAEANALADAYDAAALANEATSATAHDWKGGELGAGAISMLALCAPNLDNLPVVEYDQCGFYLYKDGEPNFYQRVTDSRPFRLPTGYTSDNNAIRIIGNVTVRSIVLGTSINALREG